MTNDPQVKTTRYGRPIVLKSIIEFAHTLAQRAIREGDTVIDATMGNGHDTVKLAQWVGSQGKVHAFDIQSQALHHTKERLRAEQLLDRCQLHLQGHQTLGSIVHGAVSVVLFNLGYLPGQDKSITTTIDTTIIALNQALEKLREGGIVIVVVYPGHSQGRLEQIHLDKWIKQIDNQQFRSLRYQFENTVTPAPYVLAIEKLTPVN